MKEECALVSYCCNIENSEKMLRDEVLKAIDKRLEQTREHIGLDALSYDSQNVFIIRNNEFDRFKLARFVIDETNHDKKLEISEKLKVFFEYIELAKSFYIETTPFGISIYSKFNSKTKIPEKTKIFGRRNLRFGKAGFDYESDNLVMVAPTSVPCMTGELSYKGITHNDLREFIGFDSGKRQRFVENVASSYNRIFDDVNEFIRICYNAYMYARNNKFTFTLSNGSVISTTNPFTGKELEFTDVQILSLLENESDILSLKLVNKENIKQGHLIYDEIEDNFYDELGNSYTKEELVNKVISLNCITNTASLKKDLFSELSSFEQFGIEKKDICKLRMEKRIQSVNKYTYSIEKFCARVGFDLYETENMKRVLCALVQKQLNPDAVFQQIVYFVSKHQGVGKTLFWQSIGKELNPTHPTGVVSSKDQKKDIAAMSKESPIMLFDEANLMDENMHNFLKEYSSENGISYRILYTHKQGTALKRAIPVVIANHVTGAVLFSKQIEARRPWIFDFSRNNIERNTFKAFHYKKGNAKHGKVTAKDLIDDACYIVKQNLGNDDFECGDNPMRKIYTEIRNKYYMESDSLDCQVELRLHDIFDYARKNANLFYWHKVKTGELYPAICLTPQKWAQLLHDGYVSGIDIKNKDNKEANEDAFKYSSQHFAKVSASVKSIADRILTRFPTGNNDPKTMCDTSCAYRKSFRGIPIWDMMNEFKNQITRNIPEKYVYCDSCYDYEKDYVYVTDDGEVFERDDSEKKFFDEDVVEYDCLKVKYDKDLMDKKCECVETHKIENNRDNDDFCENNLNACDDESLHKNELSDLCKQIEKKGTINETTKFDTVVDYLQNIILINQKNCELISEIKNIKDILSDDERDILHEMLSQHNEEYSDMIFDVDLDVKRQEELNF